MHDVAEMLGAGGPVARLVPGFEPRPQQQAMAAAVAAAIDAGATLVCEAGTGTGKTFAYLVPALTCGRRVIISTGTRTLQDQLYHRDLPLVRRALGAGVTLALLKGRANYLCRERLGAALTGALPLADGYAADLERVRAWSARTRSGDVAELDAVAEGSAVWPAVTSTADNCLGTECTSWNECFVVQARRDAAAADVVVVNHHLFLADMTLREEGFGEVLPSAEVVVFDEAHQLPDLATRFFGASISSRQLGELARDVTAARRAEAADAHALDRHAAALEHALGILLARLGGAERRADWREFAADARLAQALEALAEGLAALAAALEVCAERGPALAGAARRALQFDARLQLFRDPDPAPAVRWLETQRRAFTLHRTPLDVAQAYRNRVAHYPCAFVYTSATLAVGDDFSWFVRRLGLEAAHTQRWTSPYDFRRQALLYLPALPCEPRDPHYTRAVCDAAVPVLEASRGRAFVLFTSHRALREAAALLAARVGFPLLVQGEAPRAELLERFRDTAHAVLLGTASFWEGVDVRGEALSCVIIDKLPFASPDDPMLRARAEQLRREGGNPFRDQQLPEAVLALKQGVGRLIRDSRDRGVLVLCDPRLRTRGYGRVFIAGLPPMTVSADIDDVRRFFAPAPAAVAGGG